MKQKMTEEQARKIYFFGTKTDCEQEFIDGLKQMGYIRRDLIEEAEEMYNSYHEHMSPYSASQIMEKQHEAIQELKEKIERLKG